MSSHSGIRRLLREWGQFKNTHRNPFSPRCTLAAVVDGAAVGCFRASVPVGVRNYRRPGWVTEIDQLMRDLRAIDGPAIDAVEVNFLQIGILPAAQRMPLEWRAAQLGCGVKEFKRMESRGVELIGARLRDSKR